MILFVILPDKTQHKIEIDEKMSVLQLKNVIYDELKIDVLRQRLIHNGTPLLDDITINKVGIRNNEKIYLLYQLC